MATWREFEAAAPELAQAGRTLLYQYGPGLGFLATVRKDGGPRLHPICPMIVDGGLYAFIGNSPKRMDLLRDGRYALHACSPENVDDEFYLTGRAELNEDPATHAAVDAAIAAQGTFRGPDELLFELHIERVLHSAYAGRGPEFWPPKYTKWQA